MTYRTILSIVLAVAFSPILAIGTQGASLGVADAVNTTTTDTVGARTPTDERQPGATMALRGDAAATTPSTATVILKNAVILIGANSANDALSTPVQAGPLALDLYLQVEKALANASQGKLVVTKFQAQTPPGDVVATTLRVAGGGSSVDGDAPLQVPLTPADLLHIKLAGSTLRPSTTYKGWLLLTAGGQSNRWEVTLTTGGRGILAVEPIGTMKFTTFPWRSVGRFSVTLRDKSEGGPFHHVRVRFEPSGTPASKAITSNFSLDTFSFWEPETTNQTLQRIDLERRVGKKVADEAKAQISLSTVDLDYRGQRTLTVGIEPLSPGEYTGGLRFVADESSDDAPETKLPLIIQVRHHWTLPVLIILFGSLVGWYSSKYVVGVRKARELARQVKELRAKADDLARSDPPRNGWQFSSEGTSYGLARVRVMLSQLAQLTSSGFPMLVREEEIQQRRRDSGQRLSGLEALRATRLRVQPVADDRQAAQLALGRLLRRASGLLDRPTFDQTQQADLANLLQAAEAWLVAETRDAKYREALVDRRRSQEIPDLSLVQTLPEGNLIRQQLEALLETCPTAEMIADQATALATLPKYDQTIAKLALLWRERDTAWAELLATKCAEGKSINALFRLVDEKLWEKLGTAEQADRMQIARNSSSQEGLETYSLVEARLTSNDPSLDNRILYHPLRVGWRIVPPDGNVRTTETDGLTLVQYFATPGEATVEAVLRWQGHDIPLKHTLPLRVVPNPEFRTHRILGGGFTEWVVIVIAAAFAVATAMGTQYDSTFGSFSQYLTLFLWASGAGTGGNIFKQLGSASTPGGQPDVPLPTASPVGGAAAVK
jgi:hypothetical protein